MDESVPVSPLMVSLLIYQLNGMLTATNVTADEATEVFHKLESRDTFVIVDRSTGQRFGFVCKNVVQVCQMTVDARERMENELKAHLLSQGAAAFAAGNREQRRH